MVGCFEYSGICTSTNHYRRDTTFSSICGGVQYCCIRDENVNRFQQENGMNSKFKAGDLVFEVSFLSGIRLVEVTNHEDPVYTIEGNGETYTENGKKFDDTEGVPSLLHATQEMRENLVAIWGEDAVPKLPLCGSELTRKLLEKQKYVLCWIAAQSDDIARRYKELRVIEFMDDKEGWFVCVGGHGYNHAVPVDNNGNEIVGESHE